MARPRLLIPHYFSHAKYYPGGAPLPYEATGAKLRDEIEKRGADLDVVLTADAAATDAAIGEADYLVCYFAPAALLEKARRLRWILCAGAGIDHFFKASAVEAAWLEHRGIMLSSAIGVTRIVIAEHVLAFMLMFSRGMPRSMRQKAARHWEIFCADELYGKTVGIIGLGEAGRRVAEVCTCLGARVIGTRRNTALYRGPADEVLPADRFREVFARADFVVLTCAHNESTRRIVNRETLALMKPTAYLINVSRGELVDEAALVAALKSGAIAGAGLDTFGGFAGDRDNKRLEALSEESELWGLDNVILTPNNVSGTPHVYERLADIVAENARLLAAGGEPLGRHL